MLEKPEVQSCNFCELQKRISKIVRAGRPVTNFYGQKELVNQKFQVVQTNQTIVFWYLDTLSVRHYLAESLYRNKNAASFMGKRHFFL